MQVELPSEEMFFRKICFIGGEPCVLVTPRPGVVWSRENKIFRSSVWDKDGNGISFSLPKFCNIGEKTDVFPDPKNLNGAELLVKWDGSTLINSVWNGNLITRTRGTIDASALDTGFEIPILKQKYPKAFNNDILNSEKVSLLYEWTGKQKIVINYGDEPDIVLIAAINHEDYSLWRQSKLDELAIELGVKRPPYYTFNSLEEMIVAVKAFQGIEGLCIYFNQGNSIKKAKSDSYLLLHAIKSNLTTDKLAGLFFDWGMPNYQEFCNKFESAFDFECLNFARPAISSLYDGIKLFNEIMEHLRIKYLQRKDWTRKDYAIAAQQEYGSTKKFSVMMNLYLGKEMDKEVLKHILLQQTKQYEMGMFKKMEEE